MCNSQSSSTPLSISSNTVYISCLPQRLSSMGFHYKIFSKCVSQLNITGYLFSSCLCWILLQQTSNIRITQGSNFSSTPPTPAFSLHTFFLGDLIPFHSFKYHLYPIDLQICISNQTSPGASDACIKLSNHIQYLQLDLLTDMQNTKQNKKTTIYHSLQDHLYQFLPSFSTLFNSMFPMAQNEIVILVSSLSSNLLFSFLFQRISLAFHKLEWIPQDCLIIQISTQCHLPGEALKDCDTSIIGPHPLSTTQPYFSS